MVRLPGRAFVRPPREHTLVFECSKPKTDTRPHHPSPNPYRLLMNADTLLSSPVERDEKKSKICQKHVAHRMSRERRGGGREYNDPHHATPHMFTIQLLFHRAGWDRHHASRTRKRRLPWHLSFHDQPQPALKMLTRAQSDSSLTGLPPSSGLCASSIGGGWRGDSSLSTTSKKTMESLSSSVYDELQPFRRAHRTLIKVLDGEPPI